MARPSSLPNLGPASDRMLAEVGIRTADDLRQTGAAMAYRMVTHRFGMRVNRLLLYALAGALADRHWNSFSSGEKATLDAEAAGVLDVGPGKGL